MKPTKIIVKKPIQALSSDKPPKKKEQEKQPIQVQSSMARKIQRTFRKSQPYKKRTLKMSLNRRLPEGVTQNLYAYLYKDKY